MVSFLIGFLLPLLAGIPVWFYIWDTHYAAKFQSLRADLEITQHEIKKLQRANEILQEDNTRLSRENENFQDEIENEIDKLEEELNSATDVLYMFGEYDKDTMGMKHLSENEAMSQIMALAAELASAKERIRHELAEVKRLKENAAENASKISRLLASESAKKEMHQAICERLMFIENIPLLQRFFPERHKTLVEALDTLQVLYNNICAHGMNALDWMKSDAWTEPYNLFDNTLKSFTDEETILGFKSRLETLKSRYAKLPKTFSDLQLVNTALAEIDGIEKELVDIQLYDVWKNCQNIVALSQWIGRAEGYFVQFEALMAVQDYLCDIDKTKVSANSKERIERVDKVAEEIRKFYEPIINHEIDSKAYTLALGYEPKSDADLLQGVLFILMGRNLWKIISGEKTKLQADEIAADGSKANYDKKNKPIKITEIHYLLSYVRSTPVTNETSEIGNNIYKRKEEFQQYLAANLASPLALIPQR